MKIDLHTHTNASDSRVSREELLRIAAAQGVECIAITDHDTMTNSFSAFDDPVRVIRGVELSAQVDCINSRAHLLCYLPKDTEPLEDYFRKMREERNRNGELMVAKVHKYFPIVDMSSVMERVGDSGTIYKLHIMRVLQDFGYTAQVYGELYRQLFSPQIGKCFVPNRYEDVDVLIERIRDARGVVIFAHPSVYKSVKYVEHLAEMGMIDGVEIRHPKNTEVDMLDIRDFAKEYNLILTGGSDYHGGNNSRNVIVGDYCTEPDQFERLLELSDKK